ncbi:unnamed protein product [Caenorhabditis nigoni]
MVNTRKHQKKPENDEMLEKLKSVAAETEEIKNSHKRKFDEIGEKLRSIEESVSKVRKFDEKPKSAKKFVLKHVFENLANLKEDEYRKSKKEHHFSAGWLMAVKRKASHLEFIMFCQPIGSSGDEWSIETKLVFRTIGNDYGNVTKTSKYRFHQKNSWGFDNFLEWDDISNYLINNELTIEVEVEILKMAGFGKEILVKFDESVAEYSDIVLIVSDRKFYLSKYFLALQSSYFKALFSGKCHESETSEIELKDVNPDDFQNFLELIHGESSIDDDTVSGILQLADMYDVPSAIRRCEEFLLKNSQKKMTQKLQISLRYNLENLKSKCLSEVITLPDVQSIVSLNFEEMDLSTTKALLLKSLEFSNK